MLTRQIISLCSVFFAIFYASMMLLLSVKHDPMLSFIGIGRIWLVIFVATSTVAVYFLAQELLEYIFIY